MIEGGGSLIVCGRTQRPAESVDRAGYSGLLDLAGWRRISQSVGITRMETSSLDLGKRRPLVVIIKN